MPFKDKAKQKQYRKKHRTPYMRTYRKRKELVDRGRLEKMKADFPDACNLLLMG